MQTPRNKSIIWLSYEKIYSDIKYVFFSTRQNGKQVGQDAFGNRYFEVKASSDQPRRWVVYAKKNDPTQVCPEWHGWLHHTTDKQPTPLSYPRKSWRKPHQVNQAGQTTNQVPVRACKTAKKTYEAWRQT